MAIGIVIEKAPVTDNILSLAGCKVFPLFIPLLPILDPHALATLRLEAPARAARMAYLCVAVASEASDGSRNGALQERRTASSPWWLGTDENFT